jgi:hypothetical protein
MIASRSVQARGTLHSLTLAPVVALSCGLLLLAGCSSTTSSAAPGAGPSTGAQTGGRGGMGGAADPGRVSGEIAAVEGKTLQIQDGSAQTAVTYTSKTTFTAQVAGSVSDLDEGDCVVVFSSTTDENASSVTATSVSGSEAVDGTCAAGFGGAGARPSGAPGGQPPVGSQAPSAAPGGTPPGGAPSAGMPGGGGRPRSGKVTSINGDQLTVAVSQPSSEDTSDVTVTTTDSTTVTVAQASKASAAKAGVCATVNGKADDTGAVTATTITLRDAGADGCTVRRGNR